MIQRIQTVYLFIAALLVGSMFLTPLAEIVAGDSFYIFNMRGIIESNTEELIYNGQAISALAGISIILSIFAITQYKKRVRQMRVVGFNALILLGLAGVIFYFCHSITSELEGTYTLTLAFPVPFVASIMSYLAIRSIGKDEALVQSFDRIR